MTISTQEDFSGRVAKLIKLANEKKMTTNNMIAIISEGEDGINQYWKEKTETKVEEHKSVLSEFQL